MTPSARVLAAIGVLDSVLAGMPAEQALTNWGRSSRYAGSGDRAAVRDHVFAALRCRRSFAALGGAREPAETGRALMLGALRAAQTDPAMVFTGGRHGPLPLEEHERDLSLDFSDLPESVALDCPDWLEERLRASLGEAFGPVMASLRQRAPLFLRVNTARASREIVIAALAAEGIAARPHPLSATALEVEGNPRGLTKAKALAEGHCDLQDAASQAVAARVPLAPGLRLLDYCAGGGGKALAFAAVGGVSVFAHDADRLRMRDLEPRAVRAGAQITQLVTVEVAAAAPFDRVVLDVPCSGSGTWRRAPEAKWTLTPARLIELTRLQATLLDRTQAYVGPDGLLAYMTCSLLAEENEGQIAAFLGRHPGWRVEDQQRLTPLDGGDGFFFCLMSRRAA